MAQREKSKEFTHKFFFLYWTLSNSDGMIQDSAINFRAWNLRASTNSLSPSSSVTSKKHWVNWRKSHHWKVHPSGPKCRRCLTKETEAAFYCLVGTLWNYDGDGKESVRKAKGLISTTTTLHVHHAFSYFSLLSLHNYDVRWPNFKFTRERKRQGDKFYHLCLNSHVVPSLQLQPKFPSFK